MRHNLLFDFSVDKEHKRIHVKREFDATLALVWKAWTTAELLDQWWAPKPFRNRTTSLDFREGGHWHYAMISPENDTHWCLLDYKEVDVLKSFSGVDAFCDENRNVNTAFPRSLWNNKFSEEGGTATVNVTITFDDLADLEKLIEMGFKEGFTMGLQNLEELLSTLKK